MAKAVIYGAGSIGKGFLGELMHISSIEVIFIDVDKEMIGLLNGTGFYNLNLIDSNNSVIKKIPVKRAVDGNDQTAVAEEIRTCDIIFTAVGNTALKYITPGLAAGLKMRDSSVNIILCENMLDAHKAIKELLSGYMDSTDNIGFLRASIGRMVPLPAEGADPLTVYAEPYYHLPVDAGAITGNLPEFYGLEKIAPFEYVIDRKLYIHNLGHVACAWLGHKNHCEYIWQCVEIEDIRNTARACMMEAAAALSAKYHCNINENEQHIDDLLLRFSNKGLGDTVARVGRDSYRKLCPNERIVGALKLCMDYNLPCSAILKIFHTGLTLL